MLLLDSILGYLTGSYLCTACATSFYLLDDGTCRACPIVVGFWSRYSGLFYIFIAIIVVVICVYLLLVFIAHLTGGTLAGGARRMMTLGVWTLTTAQVWLVHSIVLLWIASCRS